MFIDGGPVGLFATAALAVVPVEVHELGEASLLVLDVSDLAPEAVAIDPQADGAHLSLVGGDDLVVGSHLGDSFGDEGRCLRVFCLAFPAAARCGSGSS